MTDRDMVSKVEVLDIYAELYDEFDGAPGIIKVLNKVYDKLNRLQSQEPVVSPPIGGWISVKDRLPENEQYVILWTKTGVMKYAKYLDDEPHRPWITYDENGSIRAWDNVVTHWMPLPEPPKE